MKGNKNKECRISNCQCTQPVQKYRTEISDDMYCSLPLIIMLASFIHSQYSDVRLSPNSCAPQSGTVRLTAGHLKYGGHFPAEVIFRFQTGSVARLESFYRIDIGKNPLRSKVTGP